MAVDMNERGKKGKHCCSCARCLPKNTPAEGFAFCVKSRSRRELHSAATASFNPKTERFDSCLRCFTPVRACWCLPGALFIVCGCPRRSPLSVLFAPLRETHTRSVDCGSLDLSLSLSFTLSNVIQGGGNNASIFLTAAATSERSGRVGWWFACTCIRVRTRFSEFVCDRQAQMIERTVWF